MPELISRHPNLDPPPGPKRPLPRWLSEVLLVLIVGTVITLPVLVIALIMAQIVHPGRVGLMLVVNRLWLFYAIAVAAVTLRRVFPGRRAGGAGTRTAR